MVARCVQAVKDRWGERTSLRTFRWVKIRDQCSTSEIAVKLEANAHAADAKLEAGKVHRTNALSLTTRDPCLNAMSHPRKPHGGSAADGLCASLLWQVVLLTNIVLSASRNSGGERSLSCSSTVHTQVYSGDDLPVLPQARKVQKWARSPRAYAAPIPPDP